jgi:hypothetical protein
VLLGTSDGTPGQVFALPNSGVYRETINLYIEDPLGSIVLQPDGGGPTVTVQQWLQVDRLLGENSRGRVYEARLSASVTNVYFGDDLSGEIPATGLDIYATYRYGVGTWGNLPPGALRNVDTTGTTGLTAVRVAATGENAYLSSATLGGADEETNQSIRDNAPLAFRSQDRVVTKQDFVSVALGTPGVSTAAAVVGSFTYVTVYITGPGSTTATNTLKTAVLDRLSARVLAGVEVVVSNPAFQPVDFGTVGSPISVTVTEGYPPLVVDDAVRRAIIHMMTELPAETPLAASDVYAAIIGVDGVQRVAIPVITRSTGSTQTDTSTITPLPWEVLSVGTINLTVA